MFPSSCSSGRLLPEMTVTECRSFRQPGIRQNPIRPRFAPAIVAKLEPKSFRPPDSPGSTAVAGRTRTPPHQFLTSPLAKALPPPTNPIFAPADAWLANLSRTQVLPSHPPNGSRVLELKNLPPASPPPNSPAFAMGNARDTAARLILPK